MRLHPRKQRAFGAGMMIALGGLVASACSTSNIHDVYTSTDGSGLHQSKVFFPGETVHCIAKLFTSRSDAPSIDWYIQPLEIAGKRVNLPPLHLDPTGPKTANKGDSLSILQFDPGSLFYAAQYHPARSITAGNAQDDPSAVALAQDIHDTFLDHLNDQKAHKNGLVDPTKDLMPPNCSKVSDNCGENGCLARSANQRSSMPGTPAARRRYSSTAGRTNASGRKRATCESPVMKMRHNSAVSRPLAKPAAIKAPELTPT